MMGRNCGGSPGQWCTWASTLEGTQLSGRELPANPGDELVMHCMRLPYILCRRFLY